MAEHRPVTPLRAIELVEAAGLPDARRVIADFAAAGLLKSYALVIETVKAPGDREEVRGGTVPTELWQRIVREGAVDDVWTGGTVRLAAAELRGGALEVNVTGIGFGEKHLQRLVDQHRPQSGSRKVAAPEVWDTVAQTSIEPVEEPVPARSRRPEPAAIPEGAILATVNQAMVAFGMGRTKVNELMMSGRLVRRHIDGGVRIEVASIWALAGAEV